MKIFCLVSKLSLISQDTMSVTDIVFCEISVGVSRVIHMEKQMRSRDPIPEEGMNPNK